MEEPGKEPVHRASVSMPSLDATDDFSTETTQPLTTDQSCGSTASSETLVSSTDVLPSDTVSFSSVDTTSVEASQPIEVASVTDAPSEVLHQEEPLDDSQAEEDPSIAIDQFIKKIADEQLSSKRLVSDQEEETLQNEENLNLEENSQENIENAIKENATTEDSPSLQHDVASENTSLEESAPLEEIPLLEETAPLEENASLQDSLSLEDNASTENAQIDDASIHEATVEDNQTLVEDPALTNPEITANVDTEPMDGIVEGEAEKLTETDQNMELIEKATETLESEDQMEGESIEDIQKEINRIPQKKDVEDIKGNGDKQGDDGSLNNEENQTQEQIEKILEGDFCKDEDRPKIDLTVEDKANASDNVIRDSSEVAKDPVIIEKAQEELRKLDVLVCGGCHNTFHFVEEFKEHKQEKCSEKSTLTGFCENESKPQVWGFILWKVKQIKDMGGNMNSSWSIYQRWCRLPQPDKNAWITAGQTIQFASKIGNAKVTEVKTKPTKQVLVQKLVDNDSLPSEFVDCNKENSDNMDVESASDLLKKGINKPVKLNNDVTILPSTKSSTNSSDQNSNKAIRTTKVLSTQKQEYAVEKIVAKRFNPRRKTWEYEIKWENFGSQSNTWEPISNLSHCKQMLEQFEEQLKKAKEEKAKLASGSPKGRGRPPNKIYKSSPPGQYIPIAPAPQPKITNVMGGVSDDYGVSGRPQRSSKQKALNQVKAWCGNISDEDAPSGIKRKYEDDSDEDYDDKRIKMEEVSDDSDKDIKPRISIKKISSSSTSKQQTPTIKNGGTGAQQILPSNILIPDANGVVRINQKQLPSLSSGVYIMSKTAGIIKLDSSTSKVATSGGQTIVKVAPKIGQTQIKIVKKDGNTTKQIIQVSPKPSLTSTPIKVAPKGYTTTQKPTPKIRKEIKRPVLYETRPPPKAPEPEHVDSDDDGLEPLPFPSADEPLPEIDSPQEDDFVLDPFTGKIAGLEYVDKPVVIKQEPQSIPPSTNDLENIVKLAAAEITEEDLHQDEMETDPLATESLDFKPLIHKQSETTGLVRRVVKYTAGQGVKSEGSILNRALTQANQRAVISPVKTGMSAQQRPRVVQQRVINQVVAQRTQVGQTRVVRQVIGGSASQGNLNVVRSKTVMPRPKFNIAPQKSLPSPLQPTRTYSSVRSAANVGVPAGNKVQVFSNKGAAVSQVGGVTRKIGNTVVRTVSNTQSSVQKPNNVQYGSQKVGTRIVQTMVRGSPKKPENQGYKTIASQPQLVTKIMTPAKPKTIISMPSLTDEESSSLLVAPKLVQKHVTAPTVAAPQRATPKLATPIKKEVDPAAAESEATEGAEGATDWSSFTMADGENPIYVTGDDGTIYQVAGQNEQGQTILITQGADGQQQCLLVTNEIGEITAEEPTPTDATTEPESVLGIPEESPVTFAADTPAAVADSVHTPLEIKTDLSEMDEDEEGVQDQVVAQVVRAEPPSPGGTHKVVVMLPDGNLMVTQVSPEEYASLELE